MNQYKQEYMTEFGYILGTMQQKYGNIIDKFPPVITDNQDGIKIFNEFVELFVDKFLESSSRDYEQFIKDNIEDVKKEFVNMDRTDKWKNINNVALKYYYELEPVERTYLADFEIINSIKSTLDNPDLKTQERLLNIIHEVWLKDEENTSESKISDEICEAYNNKEISLDSLEKADSRDLLQCVYGYDDFSNYNVNLLEQNKYIEELYTKVSNTEYKNKETDIVIIEQGIVIGTTNEIIKYLDDENEYLKGKSNSHNENYETIIRNNEIVKEEITNDFEPENIVGIKYDNEFGIYNVMDNENIIDRLENILEDYQEEEYEEEQ